MPQPPFTDDFPYSVYKGKYARPGEEWSGTSYRVTDTVLQSLPMTFKPVVDGHNTRAGLPDIKRAVYDLMHDRKFVPGGRYLYATGNDLHQVQNCLLLDVDDSREGWADLSWKSAMALMTGAGIGVYYGKVRGAGSLIRRTGGVATGPVPLAVSINEQARAYVQGGNRRSAIWAGLLWSHPDIETFIRAKDWPEWLRAQKDDDPTTPAPLDMTNISVCLDDEFFAAYGDARHEKHALAQRVYWKVVDKMVTTGEPGFSVDIGAHADEKLRNACTEIVSADDSDICNLGGLVLSRFRTPAEFEAAVRYGALFLTAGTCYSDVPYEKVAAVREKNRRLGLDILGVHEFLLARGVRYGSDEGYALLDPYMAAYDRALEWANAQQDALGLSRSVAVTSGAPTGTRGIIMETSTSWEPIPAAAYKRVVRQNTARGETRDEHYVIDPVVKRLVESGQLVEGDPVEDAFSLASEYERRFQMQAYAQDHTDQAISMTINLPHPLRAAAEQKSFGDTLIRYLPRLRGITCYPNNARAHQPIQPVPVAEALAANNVTVSEDAADCAGGACGV